MNKQSLLKSFTNKDGSINKSLNSSLITLLIVLIQKIMVMFGFSYGHWDQVAAIINTVLTILGILGVVEGDGSVTVAQTSPSPTQPVKATATLNLSIDPNMVAGSSLASSASRAEYLQSLAVASTSALKAAEKEEQNSVTNK